MALYRTLFDIVVKNSRMFSALGPKARQSWFKNFKESPALMAFENSSDLSNEQWTNLRKEMTDPNSGMKVPSLDVTIIQLCNSSKNLNLAESYLKYLRQNKHDINIALIGKYFQLAYNCKDALTDLHKKEILNMYDDLRSKHPLLDALTAESCILVISLTERWKEVVELLEMVKLSCTASSPSYSAIIAASFDHNECDMGWKYFNEILEQRKSPQSNTYTAYVDYCSKNFKKPDDCIGEIGKLFHFLAEHDLLPNHDVMEHIINTFEPLGWVGTYSKLTNFGECRKCNKQLEPLKLSQEDFSHLSKTVLNKVLVGNDIYFKSTPIEVKRFVNFVNKTLPYNVVIDGLNVGYKNKKYSPSNAAKQLASVVRYFLDKNQIVLVLGRKHMMRWDQRCMNYIKNNAFLFLTDNLSSDDPCLLYATLASGPETTFVSGDLMRQHKFILGDTALQRMFKRWQMSHQCFVNFNRDKLSLTPPLNYLPVAQGGDNFWHIPYRASDTSLGESYEPPSDWLCLERVKSRCK